MTQLKVGDRVRYHGREMDMGGIGWIGTVVDLSCEVDDIEVDWHTIGEDKERPLNNVMAGNIEVIEDHRDAGAAAHIERQETLAEAVRRKQEEFAARKPITATPDEWFDVVHDLFGEAAALLLRKHQDYGPKNISQAPGGAMNGLRVRMHDKTARLNHLLDSGDEPNHESIEDTLMDLANYSLIGVLVLRGLWPDE